MVVDLVRWLGFGGRENGEGDGDDGCLMRVVAEVRLGLGVRGPLLRASWSDLR